MGFWVNVFFLSLGETLNQGIARKNAWALFWLSLDDVVTSPSVLYFSGITAVYTELSCSPARDIKNYRTISCSLSAIAQFDFKVAKSILIILWWEKFTLLLLWHTFTINLRKRQILALLRPFCCSMSLIHLEDLWPYKYLHYFAQVLFCNLPMGRVFSSLKAR